MGGTLLTAAGALEHDRRHTVPAPHDRGRLISTWFFERTGRVWAGAFVNGFFVTWYIVAGQAVQFPI
jgi:hypothetical protein